MKKIKLSESQISMLQNLESELPTNKILKITSEQYNRIFESFEGISQPNSIKPSTKITKQFKKGAKNIPDSNFRFENETKMGDNPSIGEFGENIRDLLKDLLTNNSSTKTPSLFTTLGLNSDDLIQKMGEIGMIERIKIDDEYFVRIPKVSGKNKKSFLNNVQLLYDTFVGSKTESMVQFGDDIELSEGESSEYVEYLGDLPNEPTFEIGGKPFQYVWAKYPDGSKDVGVYSPTEDRVYNVMWFKKNILKQNVEEMTNKDIADRLRQQLAPKQGQKRSPEMIKKKLSDIRAKELKRRELEEDDEASNVIVGYDILKVEPFASLPDTRAQVDWNNRGNVYLPSIDTLDASTQILAKTDLVGSEVKTKVNGQEKIQKFSGYIESFKNKYGEYPTFKIGEDGRYTVTNTDYTSSKDSYIDNKAAGLNQMETIEGEVDEVTTAASSGAFVAPLGSAPISKGIPPSKAMEDIDEQGIGSVGAYDTPGFAPSEFMGTKGKEGKARVNKGVTHDKTMYPKGKFVKESDAFKKTQYPDGGFVELDSCTKLNNNKTAQNGGCSQGAVDNVVKTKKSKGSVVSDEALYYEVSNKTGRTIEEVRNIIKSRKA